MNRTRFLIAASTIVLLASLFALPLSAAAAAPQTAATGPGCAKLYVVVRGDRLFRIAQRFGTTVHTLTALNVLKDPNRIWVGQVLCVRAGAPSGQTYVVRRGDTLAGISRVFGWPLSYLAAINNIANVNRIYVGQKLFISSH